jgi:ABC-2 type transport system permease protein
MRLFRVELRRLWARRLTKLACLVVVAVVALTAFTVYGTAQPPTEAQLAEAERFYQQELELWEENGEEQVAQCEEDEEAAAATEGSEVDFGCDQMAPQREWFLPPQFTFVPPTAESADHVAADMGLGEEVDPRVAEVYASPWNMWETGTSSIATSSVFLLVITFALGVSFVTAEVTSGALGLWLTFEPRRQRVYWSKAAAAAIGTLPFTVVGIAALVGAVYALFAGFGTLGDVTTERWIEIAGYGGRLVVAGAAFAMIGAALGALFKHAAAAVGVALVVAWASTVFTMALGEAQRWAPSVNLTAWLEGAALYGAQTCTAGADGRMECQWVEKVVTQTQGGLYLLVLTVTVTVVAALVFRRRDVS